MVRVRGKRRFERRSAAHLTSAEITSRQITSRHARHEGRAGLEQWRAQTRKGQGVCGARSRSTRRAGGECVFDGWAMHL
eukprot:6947536-Prymnesium_polylepis.1